MSLLSGKKREGPDGDDNSVPSPMKVTSDHTLVAPPDHSKLLPIQKNLFVDLLKDDSDAVESALKELGKLCAIKNKHWEKNRYTVCFAGGAAIIPFVMKKWYGYKDVQAEGCCVLAIVLANHFDTAFNKAVRDSGGIDAILWAMKSYADDLDVQTRACEAIVNVLVAKQNATYIVEELDGVGLTIAAMRKFPDDVKLQMFASWVLRAMTTWDEFKNAIKEAGGRRALLDAIENHPDESKEHTGDLLMRARSALKNLL